MTLQVTPGGVLVFNIGDKVDDILFFLDLHHVIAQTHCDITTIH
jgi:hypothetical protein